VTEVDLAHEKRYQALMQAVLDDCLRAFRRRLEGEGRSKEFVHAAVEAARATGQAEMQREWQRLTRSHTPATQPSGDA
jgi:hypothetical protein